MKKILLSFVLLVFFVPIFVDAGSFEISTKDVYKFGNTLSLSWSPTNVGVEAIELVWADDNSGRMNLYGPKVYGDPINYKGYFTYELPNYFFVPEGEYRAKITLENGDIKYSGVFSIEDDYDDGFDGIERSQYRIGEKKFVQDEYKLGEDIVFWVSAFEKNDILAIPSNGFNVQASFSKYSDSDKSAQSVNAEYDYSRGMWKIKFDSPSATGKYKAVLALYCSDLNKTSYCGNKYGSTSYEDQLNEKITINVVKNTSDVLGDRRVILKEPTGSVLYKDKPNKISWKGGDAFVQVGIKGANGNLGWIDTNAATDGKIYWKADKVCDLAMTICWPVESIVGQYGNFRIIVVSQDKNGNLLAGKDGNYDESDDYFRISSSENVPVTEKKEIVNEDQNKKEVIKMVISILKTLNKDGSANELIQILELIISMI